LLAILVTGVGNQTASDIVKLPSLNRAIFENIRKRQRMLKKIVMYCSKSARKKRAEIFRRHFELNEQTRILDLGSEDGSHIHAILQGTAVQPQHVYIADINNTSIEKGQKNFGFNPVLIHESERLPFENGFFDIVYCSSVIEHVTVPKDEVWSINSDEQFKQRASQRQAVFANEIKRLGKQYFVQTPYKYFPIESHSWLPFIALLPRKRLISLLQLSNKVWIKRTDPDWYLLNKPEMLALFEGGQLIDEKFLGLTKSIMAIKARDTRVNP
jgi:SAM-dependent methyltransferase